MQKIIYFFIVFSMTIMMSNIYADDNKSAAKTNPAPISLYQQPDTKSPIVGSIPPSQAIMPIFTQGEWTKIADPSNGNVGWVRNETLQQQGIPTIKTITQSLNLGMTPMDDKQVAEMMKKWQAQRNQMQSVFGEMLQQNIKALDALSKELQDPNFQFPMVIPVLQPVVVMPNKTGDKMVVPVTTQTDDAEKD